MKTFLTLGVVNGTKWSIHWTFGLIVAWLLFVNLLAGPSLQALGWVVLLFGAGLASLMLHEAGHAAAARWFGIEISSFDLLPVGAVPGLTYLPVNSRQEWLVCLAGPLFSLLAGFGLVAFTHPFVAYWNEPANLGVANAGNFLFQCALINLVIGFVNLLPAYPLDGGRALTAMVRGKKSPMPSIKQVTRLSKFIACGLIVTGFAVKMIFPALTGILILFSLSAEKDYLPVPGFHKMKPHRS